MYPLDNPLFMLFLPTLRLYFTGKDLKILKSVFPSFVLLVLWLRLNRSTARVLNILWISNGLHLAKNICLDIFPRSSESEAFEETSKLRGTNNVQRQMSEHLFTPMGCYCVYYSSNIFIYGRSFGETSSKSVNVKMVLGAWKHFASLLEMFSKLLNLVTYLDQSNARKYIWCVNVIFQG